MTRPRLFHRLLHGILVAALLFSTITPALLAQENIYLPLVTNGQQGQSSPATNRLFRTHVTVNTPAQWRALAEIDVVILAQAADGALLLVDDEQLATLARLRYNPEATNAVETLAAAQPAVRAALATLLTHAATLEQPLKTADPARSAEVTAARQSLRTAMRALDTQQVGVLSQAATVDSDNDGLTDDQEGWWCTDVTKPDSDFDGTKDGAEVTALKAWLNNKTFQYPSTGRPFPGWPVSPTSLTCTDGDQDAVPDLVEALELGLNPGRESTDRDKFDDGQELFGQTYCNGQGGYCGYGPLPRNADWGVIFAEMPAWVRAPGNHPLVGSFPAPEVDIVDSSLRIALVTTITDGETVLSGVEKSYSTSSTEGTSTSIADTITWNEWEEMSKAETAPANYSPDITASSIAAINEPLTIGAIAATVALGLAVNCVDDEIKGTKSSCRIVVEKTGELAKKIFETQAEVQRECIKDAYEQESEWHRAVQLNMCFPNTNLPIMTWRDTQSMTDMQPMCSAKPEAQTSIQSCKGPISTVTQSVGTSTMFASNSESEFQNRGEGSQGVILRDNNTSISASPRYPLAYPIAYPSVTQTTTKGKSRGGGQTTTTQEFEEHTVTNGEAFLDQQSWTKTTAVNSAHAANLWFSYKVRNMGTEFAHEICNLTFNVYIGDDPNPAYTYFVPTDRNGACFTSFDPGEEHMFSARTNTHAIPLTLEQMKTIDLGGRIRIIVEDFTYGIDERFYKDAATAGVLIALEDGTDDGDETIDTYLIPTWGNEKVLNVLARYFPHETDADGTITAIWTPEYLSTTPAWCQSPRRPTDQPSKAVWCKHVLSTADWWNVYTDGLGDGSEGFQDARAVPGATALFRFNKDSDLDGFSDRSEVRLGTDPKDAASFPRPEVLAGVHEIRVGNKVTATLSLLNTGPYDAYGVEAVLVAPDDSISITNNTVGGSGRVKALKQVIVGSSIKLPSPLPGNWTQSGHAVPAAGGYYTGTADRTYTFTVAGCGAGGCTVGSGAWTLNWSDGAGSSGSLNFGTGYQSPTFLPVGNLGVTLALYSGKVTNGESFTVAARTPRDTFQYTINREPHTAPLVIVSSNDPQGNHRFVIPSQAMTLTAPTADLTPYAGQMLHDVGVELVTTAPATVGSNRVNLLVNNPSSQTLQDAHLFLELINISGTVVAEIPTQVTLLPGPTSTAVTFTTTQFDPPYQGAEDYIVMAFLTDYQGNILDTAGRPLSSFQVDPLPALAADTSTLIWDFGTVAQGTLLQHQLAIANQGFGRLYTYLPPTPGLSLSGAGQRTVGAADSSAYLLRLNTLAVPLGPYSQTVTLTTNDPAVPALQLTVVGTVTGSVADIPASALQRPLDVPVVVTGTHSQGEWIEYTHTMGPDASNLHPVKVYSQDYTKLWGVGKVATNFSNNTASAEMFGDGRDGVMPSSGNLDNDSGFGTGSANGSAGSYAISVIDHHAVWRINPGDVVLIHQTQGTGAGNWELNKAVSNFNGSGIFTLDKPLKYTYSTSGSNRAQIMRVPQYSTCNVTGTVTPLGAWNGDSGGIFAVMCSDVLRIAGAVSAAEKGFRGGRGGDESPASRADTGQTGESYSGPQLNGPVASDDCGGCTSPIGPANGGGGYGGRGSRGTDGASGGGGGSYGSIGTSGQKEPVSPYIDGGTPGSIYGVSSLSQLHLGSGGGGGGKGKDGHGADGGSGGGILVIQSRAIELSGSLTVVGSGGTNNGTGNAGGGGGGSGGSIHIRTDSITIASNTIFTNGGGGGPGVSHGNGSSGGNGGNGRTRIEYCTAISGTTNPPASTQKLDCYITEQTVPSTFRFSLPEAVNGTATYNVQFGRKLDFAAAGEQVTTLRLPVGMVSSAHLDALVSGLPANAMLTLDIGNDGTVEFQADIANNSTNQTANLAAALTAYWQAQGSRLTGTLDVPIKVTLSQPGQVLLTNLQVQTVGSQVRQVRLPVETYTTFTLDFTLGSPGTVALDIGDNGSINWSINATTPRQVTGNLATAINAYLSGKSGTVDLPIRVYVNPHAAVTLNDYTATINRKADLVAQQIIVDTPAVQAAAPGGTIEEGESVTVRATLRNSGNLGSGPITAAFFANAAGWGDWYIGSTFVENLAAGATVEVSTLWNTTGFSGTVPVKVVVNPYGRTLESNYTNNSKATSAAVFAPALGDINGEGNIDIFDLQRLINMILHPTQPDPALYPPAQWRRGDLRADDAWNIFDLQQLINKILGQQATGE